jgi:hypothetical protein
MEDVENDLAECDWCGRTICNFCGIERGGEVICPDCDATMDARDELYPNNLT